MSWDAGSIEATLRIATAQADADLALIEARVKALEDKIHLIKFAAAGTAAVSAELAKLEAQVQGLEGKIHVLAFTAETAQASADVAGLAAEVAALDKPHVISIGAVFNDADIAKARRAFQLLDNAVSRDAMQRLRSSPQGSVLGALNALFSPHPVTGGPSPQQAAAKGLLGQMFSPQGGGAAVVPGGTGGGGNVLPVAATSPQPQPDVTVAAQVAAADGLRAAAAALKAAAGGEAVAAAAQRDAAGSVSGAAAALKGAAGAQTAAAFAILGAAAGLRDALTGLAGVQSVFAALRQMYAQQAAAAGTAAAAAAGAGNKGGGGAGAAAAGAAAGAGNQGGGGSGTGAAIGTALGVTRLNGLQIAAANAALGLAGVTAQARTATPALNAVGAAAGAAAGNGGAGGGGLNAMAAAAGAAAGGAGGGKGAGLAGVTAAAGGAGRAVGGMGGILGGTIGGIGLFHLALDLSLEALIAVTAAAAAAATGIAAMTPAAKDIYTHLQAVQTVNSALGTQITPLTGQFQALGQAMAPQVIEAYGGALLLVSRNTGIFGRVGAQVVTMFDDWIAKLNIWAAAQKSTGGILQAGVGFLSQFGHIVDQLGMAFVNLMKSDPGTAHMLLDILGAGAGLLNVISKLPAPVLEAGLAIHSLYLYGSVVGGVLAKIPGPLGAIGRAAAKLSTPQLLGLAAVGIAIVEMARTWDSASASVSKDIAAVNASLASMSAGQAMTGISASIGTLRTEMASVNTSEITKSWTGLNGIWQETGDKIQAVGHELNIAATSQGSFMHQLFALGDAFKLTFDQGAAASAASSIQQQHDIAALQNKISSLLGSQASLYAETGNLMKSGDSFSQALAIMSLAGIKAGDSLDLMNQKIKDLENGYKNMAGPGGAMTNALNAVEFASLQQSSSVSKLNSSWDAFISMLTGGASTFTSFANQVTGLYQSMTAGGVKLSNSGGKVSSSLALIASSAGGTAVSMTGLNTASLNAQQTFLASVTAANSQMDALTTLASAAGLGSQGTDMLTQANKDLVSALLPAASGSSTLTAVLYGLAQRGGYQGADSFHALSQWVGKTQQPMQDLQGIVGTLTQAAGNLTSDVQNLSTALGTTLTDAMAQVILAESGGLKPMENLFSAIHTTGLESGTTAGAALALAQQYVQLTGSVSTAHDEFVTFTEKALNLTQAQADALWNEISGKLTPAVAGTGAAADTAAGQIEQHFIADLKFLGSYTPQVGTDITNFGNAILNTGNTSTATQGARAQLIKDLEAAGLNAQQATSMVGGLQTQIDGLHGKAVPVTVTASAQGTLNAIAHLPGANPTASALIFGAAGMYVSGGTPGKDSVLAMLMPGEVVVPAGMVQAGAVDHLKGSIPGFAAGGMVNLDQPGQWTADQGGSWAQQVEQAWAKGAQAAFEASAAQAATAAAAAFVGTQGASGGIIQSMMKNMAAARGWTGAEWNALAAVETREAGWNMTATNPTSGAYGLAQFINGPSEYAQYGGNSTTAQGQITGMLSYISQRYGDPIAAWNHEVSYGWYDNGGSLKPGYTLAYNGTSHAEPVVPSGGGGASVSDLVARLDQLHADMREMVSVTRQVPAATGQHVGAAIGGASQAASFRSRFPRSSP